MPSDNRRGYWRDPRASFVHTMPETKDAELHRRNVRRYRYLLDFMRDPETRRILEQLLKDAEQRLGEIERDPHS